jgi:hypothetical protein
MKQLLLITTVFVAIFSSCKDEHNSNGKGPSVTIISPAEDAEFKLVDTVNIKATVSHSVEMHTYKVTVMNEKTGNKTVLKDEHDHAENINVEVPFYLNEENHNHYYIIVSAEDHDGNAGADTVYIHSDN